MVLYTPLIKTLRKWFPHSNITLLCGNNEAAEIVRGSNIVNDIWVLDKLKFKNYVKILKKSRKKKFDMIVTSYLDRSFKVGVFCWLSGASIRIGYDYKIQKIFYNYRTKLGSKDHEVEQNIRLIKNLSDKGIVKETTFFLKEDDEIFADNYLKTSNPLFGFHPGSGIDVGGNTKRWDVEKFAGVADNLAKKYNAQILIFGGPGEEGLGKKMADNMTVKPVDLTGKLSIKKTAALIKRCSLFITNDSGLMHIAASFGIRVVAIFGPTLYWKNYPWNTKYKIIRKDLTCGPCYEFQRINCDFAACLKEITVDEVYKASKEILNAKK